MSFNRNNQRNGNLDDPPVRWQAGNIESDDSMEHSTKPYFKIPTQRRLKIAAGVAAVLFVLCIILLILCIHYYNKGNKIDSRELCTSHQCIRSAASLLGSMNKSVDPCEDFYQFTCGRWHEEHPIPYYHDDNSWSMERMYSVIHSEVEEFLQRNSSSSDPKYMNQARMMYHACTDVDKQNELGLEPLRKVLEKIGLPLIPPLNENDYLNKYSSLNINKLLAKVKTTIAKDVILQVNVMPNTKNTKRNIITIGSANGQQAFSRIGVFKSKKLTELTEELPLVDGNNNTDVNLEKKLFHGLIKYFIEETEVTDISDSAVNNAAETLFDIYDMMKERFISSATISDDDTDPKMMSISELQKIVDKAVMSTDVPSKINWNEFLSSMFENVKVKINLQNETLAVHNTEHLSEICSFLAHRSNYEIMLYIWYEVVDTLIPYTNDKLRELKMTLLEEPDEETNKNPKEKKCAESVTQSMSQAIAIGIFQDVDIKKVKADINKMIDNIEYSSKKFMSESKWIDEKTKSAIIDKVTNIGRLVGYQDWIGSRITLENYYSGLMIRDDAYMMNFVSVSENNMIRNLEDLPKDTDFKNLDFDPLMVNAAYLPSANLIAIPLAILQFPFYDLGLDSLNYGAIGMILGHELTHAFDTTGRKYDKFGNVKNWWPKETIANYLKQAKCFADQYDQYELSKIDKHVNGSHTLSENIADNGGLKDAFHGFKKLKEDKSYKDFKLPGLESYSSDQLFYLGFAHTWCEVLTEKAMENYLDDEHSPKFVRVLATLQNSKEFSKTWNCRAGSTMNPSKKCELW